METRKNEYRKTTKNLDEMSGRFLAEDLIRKWVQDILDEDTGTILPVERTEKLLTKGCFIDGSNLQTIQFYMESGDIREVTVSDQKRSAFELKNTHFFPWLTVIRIGEKNKKFILYAATLEMAVEIVKDYVELNFTRGFYILSVKSLEEGIILRDAILSADDPNEEQETRDEKKFYEILVKILTIEGDSSSETQHNFIVEARDVERSMEIINSYVDDRIKQRKTSNGEPVEEVSFKTMIETAKILPYNYYIDREFSLAYQTEQ